MSLDSKIIDPNTLQPACVYDPSTDNRDGKPGLEVYTAPRHIDAFTTFPLLNSTYGLAMNQNVSFGGTPDSIYAENVEWTSSALSGTWDFASTAQANSGTLSINATGTTGGDEAQLERSSSINTGDYVVLSGAIYITSWPTNGTKEIELRFRLAGADSGSTVELSGFINQSSFNGWQNFIIPLTNFGAGTIDQLVIETIDIGGGQAPNYYLDDIQLEESSGFLDFTYAPPPNQKFTINKIGTIFVTTATEAATRTYNEFMGITRLDSGVLLFKESEGVVFNSIPIQDLFDYVQFPQTTGYETISDGTSTITKMTVDFIEPLDGRKQEKFTSRIQDDLSSLVSMRTWLFGTIEDV